MITMSNYFSKFNAGAGIPFMNNSTKGEITDLCGEELHIIDFGFITNDNGKFSVIAFKEHPHKFYFGGLVLTNMLESVEHDGMRDELPSQTIVLDIKHTKDGKRTYMSIDFIDAE